MLPPIHPDALRAGAVALRPVGNLGATFARDDAQRVLSAAWPHLAADALLWAAAVADAEEDADVAAWLRGLADRVSRLPAPGARP